MADCLEAAIKFINAEIEDRLEKGDWEQWTDPGDYPNGLASGPLPDGKPELTYDDESPVVIPWDKLPGSLTFAEDECLLLSEDRVKANNAWATWTAKSVTVDAEGVTITLSIRTEVDDGL